MVARPRGLRAAEVCTRPKAHAGRSGLRSARCKFLAFRRALTRPHSSQPSVPVPPSIGASSIKTVSLVGKIASAFVTFSDEAAQRGALALDGCAITLDGNDAAPILHVAPHGRKRKGHGNHSHSTVASASAAWYKMAPPTGAEERPRARQPSTCEIALTPCGPTTVALKLMAVRRNLAPSWADGAVCLCRTRYIVLAQPRSRAESRVVSYSVIRMRHGA